MALKKAYDPGWGIELDAYHVVSRVEALDAVANLVVASYKDQATKTAGGKSYGSRNYQMPFDKAAVENAHTQAYTWLKTQADFSDAVDV